MRILLVDEHDVVRHGLRSLLEMRSGWTVVGEAQTGAQAVELAASLQPDVAILDIALSQHSGLEATREIRRVSPETEVLVFTWDDSERNVRDVLAAGARGYLLKSDAAQSVAAAVEAIAEHRLYFNSRVGETIVGGFIRGAAEQAAGDANQLTAREREIVRLLAEGNTNKQIASQLQISVKTVETHRAAAMRKVNTRSIVGLIRYAMRSGLSKT